MPNILPPTTAITPGDARRDDGFMTGNSMIRRRSASYGLTWEALRVVVLGAFFGLIWIFPNLDAASFSEDPNAGQKGTLLVQLLWFAVAGAAMLCCQDRWPYVRRQFDITMMVVLLWCLFTVPFAIIPDVSFRRFLYTAIAMIVVIFIFGGIENSASILKALLIALVIETLVKYFYVFARPDIGRHTFDSLEPQLAGFWRGQYAHKNTAGPVCALELFILYAARYRVHILYLGVLAVPQLIFLVMSGSKTPLLIVLIAMALSKWLMRLKSYWALLLVAVGAVAFINSVTVLTVVSDGARDMMASVLGDASFTGRADIWSMLLSYAGNDPWFGAGFASFWQIGFASPAMQDGRSWTSNAIYGHQGYLDLVVTIGVPGLALALIFLILRPVSDLSAIRYRAQPMLEMYTSFWLFGMLHNGTESNLLSRADPIWLFVVLGIVGIRRTCLEELVARARPQTAMLRQPLNGSPIAISKF
jgi:O-antigen ligase